MKIFKVLLLNCFFVGFAFVVVLGAPKKTLDKQIQEKITHDSAGFFEMLKNQQQTFFDAQTKKQIIDLYLLCKVNDVKAINKFSVSLKSQNAQTIVAATLLFAVKHNDKVVGRNLLDKQKIRKIIFDAFDANNNIVFKLLLCAIDVGIDVDAFDILKKIFEKIFLANDNLQEKFSTFFNMSGCNKTMQFLYASAAESKAKRLIQALDQVAEKFDLDFWLSDGVAEFEERSHTQDKKAIRKTEKAAEKEYEQYCKNYYANEDSFDPDEEIFRY